MQWAIEVQTALPVRATGARRPTVRIGVNVEDVIVDEDDLHGDGVNIAARIQQLANPGEIVLTAAVREYVWNKLGVALVDLGERPEEPVAADPHSTASTAASRSTPTLQSTARRRRMSPGATGRRSR